jgi:hypothetical protein
MQHGNDNAARLNDNATCERQSSQNEQHAQHTACPATQHENDSMPGNAAPERQLHQARQRNA